MNNPIYLVKGMLPMQQGTSARGNWVSQDVIVEEVADVEHPDTFLLHFTGNNVDKLRDIKVNMQVTANWSAYVRKFQGKDGNNHYSQELRAWRIEEVPQTF